MTARTMKKGKGQADAPAPVLPDTNTAPGAEAAPGEGSTAAAVPSPGPEGEGKDSSGPAATAESGGDAPKGAGDGAPPADTDDAGQLAGVVTSALAAEELQRRRRMLFEGAIDSIDINGILLQVAPSVSIWRGGRHFTAGSTAVLKPVDVTREQLARILAERAFTCTFLDAAADA